MYIELNKVTSSKATGISTTDFHYVAKHMQTNGEQKQ